MNPWDARYAGETYFYGTEPNTFLVEQAWRFAPGSRLLCLAEGEGRNAVWLAGLGHRVTAVDSSAGGLRKAERLAADRGVHVDWLEADLAVWPMGDAAWDGVVSIWAHVLPELRQGVDAAIRAAVRPGGLLVLEHYHPRQLAYGTGGPPDARMMATLEALHAAFPGWHAHHAVERDRDVREGKGHHGLSHVTQVVLERPPLSAATQDSRAPAP
ncbi:MAG: methyltransferase domain-containing protein [Candidatus Sericytochromatia bacterium]|nr:methyltransferase domain-containing protein [Candidatus Sericytochromatia bacterium]